MKFKLLVIDDEKIIREGLAEYLREDGYEVVCAQKRRRRLEYIFGRGH